MPRSWRDDRADLPRSHAAGGGRGVPARRRGVRPGRGAGPTATRRIADPAARRGHHRRRRSRRPVPAGVARLQDVRSGLGARPPRDRTGRCARPRGRARSGAGGRNGPRSFGGDRAVTDLVLSVDVEAPAGTTWLALTDWTRQGEWLLATEVKVVEGNGRSVGSRLAAFTGVAGIGFTDTMEITSWEPPVRCAVRHLGTVV